MKNFEAFWVLCLLGLAVSLHALSVAEPSPADDEWGFRPGSGELLKTNPSPFVWKEQKNAVSYDLEYSADPDFKEPVKVYALKWNLHCPSSLMNVGKWHWRVRFTDSTGNRSSWSSIRTFEISAGADRNPMPEKADLFSMIPAKHPRIFLRPEDIPVLKNRSSSDLKEEYQELIKQCEALKASPPDTREPQKYPDNVKRPSKEWIDMWWGNRIKVLNSLGKAAVLGFGYQISGDRSYGELAKKILLDAAEWDPRGSTSILYNDEAGMPYVSRFSRTYSFIYDLLSEEEKTKCREAVRIRANDAFNGLYPKHFYRPYNSHNNRLWHFLGEAGLVFYNEIPEAENWLWAAMNVYFCVYPVWGDEDGGWNEGIWYWYQYQERFFWWGDIMKKAFNINIAAKSFYSQTGYFAMYLMPPGSGDGGFGDLSELARRQHGHVMLALSTFTGNPYWKWYAEQLSPLTQEDIYIAFMRSSYPQVKAKAPSDLPSSKLFRGTGLACLNTNLLDGKKNVQILFKSSPMGTPSHGYDANNSFLLNVFGERLLLRSGLRDNWGSDFHRNWMWDTKSENCITVNGESQIKASKSARGEITGFHTGKYFDYVAGEAAASYGGKLKSFKRQILFCKPSAILIVDSLAALEPSTFSWKLHAANEMKINSQHDVRVVNKDAACRVDFLYPEALAVSQTDKFEPALPVYVKLVQYHLSADIPDKLTDACFITLIRPHRSNQEIKDQAALVKTSEFFVVTIDLPEGMLTIRVNRRDFSIHAELGSESFSSLDKQ